MEHDCYTLDTIQAAPIAGAFLSGGACCGSLTVMCKCIHSWVEDPEVDGPHSVKPISCESYISALEHELIRLSSADNPVLDRREKAEQQTLDFKMSDCTGKLGQMCRDTGCPFHFGEGRICASKRRIPVVGIIQCLLAPHSPEHQHYSALKDHPQVFWTWSDEDAWQSPPETPGSPGIGKRPGRYEE